VTRTFELSGDLARPYVLAACILAAASIALLVYEIVRSPRSRLVSLGITATGLLAVLALLGAVLRPVSVVAKGSLVGSRVVVLADASRSIDLPGLTGSRRDTSAGALAELRKRSSEVRFAWMKFSEGPPAPLAGQGGTVAGKAGENLAPAQAAPATPPEAAGPAGFRERPELRSDLAAALEALAHAPDERPAAIVVLSDGRLDRPGVEGAGEAARAALGKLGVPIHAVALASDPPVDASIRAVRAAGTAVAHQPLSLRIDVGCAGGLNCDEIPVVARELREQGAPASLAAGKAHVRQGSATVELSFTLDRAGTRILEVEIEPPAGDTIRDNDKRYITLDVARDRVRVLHVAGRPTYDVRALRMWLKSDASVDVVAFFILRSRADYVHAEDDELALIPFPVDELFTEHLPSFDAVVLQDFNAAPYGLSKYLARLARYVDKGGGLIMVGGPDAFVPGNYAGTPLATVLPVDLESRGGGPGIDVGSLTPRLTDAGLVAPVLAPLRALIGEDLPEMPGTNVVGDAQPGSTVLLVHPSRKTPSGAPMPLLVLGEHGSGRTIALTLDGSHRLLFSAFAASAAGRAHGAFWDAMLGWLMRDPRFEPAVVDVQGGCIAGEETTLVLRPLPGPAGEAKLIVKKLGSGEAIRTLSAKLDGRGEPISIAAGRFDPGGYSATVELITGAPPAPAPAAPDPQAVRGPTTRRDFACEMGGDEWADSRPDPGRLRAIAAATGGSYVLASDAASLPLPPAMQVAAERRIAPMMPPWAWTLWAAAAVGVHWIVRRKAGLS
jgi:uncharacterized membrane protein